MSHRICIIGNSGSGKSTLADAVSRRLGTPAFHLDRELLHGQFEAYPKEEQARRHADLVKGDSWVIDGNYWGLLPQRLDRATAAVFLDVSRAATLPRVVRRYLAKSQLKSSVPAGAADGLSLRFVRWVARYSRRERLRTLRELCAERPGVRLITLPPGTVSAWVESVVAAVSD